MNNIQEIISAERDRQERELTFIPSENYVSKAVMDVTGSILTNKYAEGYPGKRYYAGNYLYDELEELVKTQAQTLFETDYHVNVQPHSGAEANLAAYSALLQPGDTVLSMHLPHGGHLSHGHSVSFTSSVYNFVHYGVAHDTELIDYDEVRAMAREHRPKLIVCGATAYPMLIDFAAFARIAREVGAWLMVDMAHFAGLVAGHAHTSPFGIADIITTTTHKTLRGPRGAMIFCRKEFTKAVDRAVFPGLQGGPHMHTIGAVGVALTEALTPAFSQYARAIVQNAKTLAYRLQTRGLRLVADGTETHLMLLDLRSTGKSGKDAQLLLEESGIICNMNTIPYDPSPAMSPSGIRLGTPAATTRGMREKEMEVVADLIADVLFGEQSPTSVRAAVEGLARRFRIPTHH